METFYWETERPHSNNEETMQNYLDYHLPNNFEIESEDGTCAEIINTNSKEKFRIHASGDGDFTHHRIDFELLTPHPTESGN
jgi:hypothetical protein